MNKNMLLQNLTMKNNPPHPAKSLAPVGRIILGTLQSKPFIP